MLHDVVPVHEHHEEEVLRSLESGLDVGNVVVLQDGVPQELELELELEKDGDDVVPTRELALVAGGVHEPNGVVVQVEDGVQGDHGEQQLQVVQDGPLHAQTQV